MQDEAHERKRPHLARGWTWLLVPKPFDLVSSSLYIALLMTFFAFGCDCVFSWWHVTLLIGCICVLLLVDRLEYWFYGEETPARTALVLLLTRIILIEAVAQLDNFNFSPFLYLIPPFLACLYFGNKVSYGVAAIAWITYVVKLWLRTSDWYHNDRIVNNLIVFTLGLIFSITMARTVVGEKASRAHAEQLLAELEESHQQLKTYAAQVAELATTKERNRLARDIHDSLGHYLTVINVQLEKALAFRTRKPAEADLAVGDAKRLASEALQDVRRSVGTLRTTDETFTFPAAIDELVERVRSDQLALEVCIQGSEADFSKQALIALYRAVQEGLTNVQKHAKANAVHLDVQFAERETTMCLRDNGNGFDLSLLQALQPERDGQYGLQGLQERLELVGGRLHIESVPGQGTQLFVAIPKNLLPAHSTLAFPAH